jgi:hypothetical protein
MLRHYVWPYSPDLVLLAVFPRNDIRNNSLALETDQGRPFYQFVEQKLVLDSSRIDVSYLEKRQASRWFWFKDAVIRNVRIAGTAYLAKENFRKWRERSKMPSGTSIGEAGLDDHVYFAPMNNDWEDAWLITSGVLNLMHREVNEKHAKFLAVVLNSGDQVNPDAAAIRQKASQYRAENLDYPDVRLAEIAKQSGFPLFSLTEPMRTIAQRDQIFYHGFPNTQLGTGHWNEAGHQTAGELIAKYLCDHQDLLEGHQK